MGRRDLRPGRGGTSSGVRRGVTAASLSHREPRGTAGGIRRRPQSTHYRLVARVARRNRCENASAEGRVDAGTEGLARRGTYRRQASVSKYLLRLIDRKGRQAMQPNPLGAREW